MPSIEHRGAHPRVDESAYIAPNAVLSGAVTVGANASILSGVVVTADGGPVEIGPDCVIMENAVIRGTPRHPARLGQRVLVGPHAHLTGCVVADDVFLATGVTVFNGATIGSAAEVRINGVVHVNTEVPPETTVPIGWVAVGQPAQLFPPDEHDRIWSVQRTLDFPGTVWGVERSVPRGERTRRYAHALRRHHADDRVLDEARPETGSDSPDHDVLEVLLDSWDRNNTILLNLLRVLPEGGLEARAVEGGPTVAQLFTHMNYVRLVLVFEDAPEFAGGLPEKEWVPEGDRGRMAQMLADSARTVRAAVEGRIRACRPMDVHYDHPILLIQHLLWHEAYHHGQIKLALKQAGNPLTDDEAGPLTWDVWMRRE